MIAEWGQLALLGALLISIIQGVLPLIGASLITSGSASAVLLPGAEAARQ